MKQRQFVLIISLLLLSFNLFCLNDMGKGGSYDGAAMDDSGVINLSEISGDILPPENVIITVSNNQVILNWSAVVGAISYKVYASDNYETGFEEDTTGNYNNTVWTSPLVGIKKFYYVKSCK